MIDRNEMERLLDGVPEEDLRSAGQVVVVKLGGADLVESAALADPVSGAFEGLCLTFTMGADDIDGMEDDTVEIGREEDGPPLAELTLPQEGGIEVADSGDASLLFWNCSGRAVAVGGDRVEAGRCLLLKALSGEELDRMVQAYLRDGGGVRC